jgi:ribosomal protein S18 acetylase RimI-like enzyme
MGGLVEIDNERGQIKRMRVHPQHQRRGYGRSVLLRLESHAAERRLTALCLDTSPLQVAALGLYASNGYREIGRGQRAGFQIMEKTWPPHGATV